VPRTTLGLRVFRARPRRREDSGGNDDVNGAPLMGWLGAFLNLRQSAPLRDDTRSRYLRVSEVFPRGRSVTVVTRSGAFGEPGSTYHVETNEETHVRSELEAATSETRTVFWAPPGAPWFVAAYEMKRTALHGGVLLDDFLRWMRRENENFFFPTETVMEQDAWAASGNLTAVSVVRHDRPLNLSQGIDRNRSLETVLGRVVYTALPPRGQRTWPTRVWDSLRNGQVEAGTFVGIRHDDETSTASPDESVFVTVERDGRHKKFELGTDGVPSVRLVLTEDHQPALELNELHDQVDERVRAFYQDTDLGWSSAWLRSEAADRWVERRV
jgi:hypothetical protein